MKHSQLIDFINEYHVGVTGLEPPVGLVDVVATHYSMLVEWSKVVSLTGSVDQSVVGETLYLDSLIVASRLAVSFSACRTVHDVGSGAGFPGVFLPLYLRGGRTVVLHEARRRKASFLRAVLRATGHDEVVVSERRVDNGSFAADAVLSRATLPPRKWLDLASTLVGPGGRIALLLAGNDRSVTAPCGQSDTLALVAAHDYVLPVSGRARAIHVFERKP